MIVLRLVADGVLREPILHSSLYFKTHRALYYELLNKVDGEWLFARRRIYNEGNPAWAAPAGNPAW